MPRSTKISVNLVEVNYVTDKNAFRCVNMFCIYVLLICFVCSVYICSTVAGRKFEINLFVNENILVHFVFLCIIQFTF